VKIAIIADSLGVGGAERQVLYAVGALARRGYDVELIYYHQARDSYDPSITAPGKVTFITKGRSRLLFLWRLWRHFKRRGYDLVHGFKGVTCLYSSLAARLAGVPVALAGFRTHYHLGKGKTFAFDVVYRLVNRLSDGWIVNSRAIADSLVEGVGARADRCYVVYNGIEQEKFASPLSGPEARAKLDLPAGCATVTMVARITPEKQHGMFLEMAAVVAARHPETRFLIVGGARDEELLKRLRNQADELGISQHVRFLGWRSDIPDVLAATDISVLTSDYEGLSNSVVEAMCAGKPVISTDYPGVDEIVRDGVNGFVVPRRDATAMAEKVCLLLEDPPLRRQMGQAGRQIVREQFSVEAMTEKLLEVYRQTLEEKARAH